MNLRLSGARELCDPLSQIKRNRIQEKHLESEPELKNLSESSLNLTVIKPDLKFKKCFFQKMRFYAILRARPFRQNFRSFFALAPTNYQKMGSEPKPEINSSQKIGLEKYVAPEQDDIFAIYVETEKTQTGIFDDIEKAVSVTISDLGNILKLLKIPLYPHTPSGA